MFLAYRPAGLSDLQECQHCLRDAFAYTKETRQELVALWETLLRSGAGSMAVIEDRQREAGKSILWCCFKVFLTPEYAYHLKNDGKPIPGLQLIQQTKKGSLPVFSAEEIRQANSPAGQGVTMLVVNSGFSPGALNLSESDFQLLLGQMIDFNYYFCAGYHLNEILIEMYDELTSTWADGAGLRLRMDYGEYPAPQNDAVLSPPPHPKLYGITPAEGKSAVGRIFATIVEYRPPILGLSEGEQELLFRAMLGETDEELAEALYISLNTVKKRWNSIYSRIENIAPQILDAPKDLTSDSLKTRGKEKKRHVVAYLRHHMEELRPYQRPTALV